MNQAEQLLLVVEDSEEDYEAPSRALDEIGLDLQVERCVDGDEAIEWLDDRIEGPQKILPSLILLDLNLPGSSGAEVLEHIKSNAQLRRIPVVILTTSKSEEDVMKTYGLHANCYITKPVDLEQFINVVRSIEDFWLGIVKLPGKG